MIYCRYKDQGAHLFSTCSLWATFLTCLPAETRSSRSPALSSSRERARWSSGGTWTRSEVTISGSDTEVAQFSLEGILNLFNSYSLNSPLNLLSFISFNRSSNTVQLGFCSICYGLASVWKGAALGKVVSYQSVIC
jgi:hypothetical protein